MDHPQIDNDKIIDRYLVGRLAPENEALFEEHLFACADCLEKVQWGEELRRGLRAVAAEDGARALSQGVATLGLMAWLRSRRPGQLAGLMVLALALVLPSAIALRQRAELIRVRAASNLSAVGNAAGSAAIESAKLAKPMSDFFVVSLGLARGGDPNAAEIRLDPAKQAVLLSLELGEVDAARYRVTLRGPEGEILWTGDDLEPNLYDTLLVALPSSFLAPGSYRIATQGLPPGSSGADEMEFRVLPPM